MFYSGENSVMNGWIFSVIEHNEYLIFYINILWCKPGTIAYERDVADLVTIFYFVSAQSTYTDIKVYV